MTVYACVMEDCGGTLRAEHDPEFKAPLVDGLYWYQCEKCGHVYDLVDEKPVRIPAVVSTGQVKVGGLTIVVNVLDDGRRIVDKESFDAFTEALAGPAASKLREFMEGVGKPPNARPANSESPGAP